MMAARLTLDDLIEAAKQLSPDSRERLVRALTVKPTEPSHEITELRGLGKEIWNNQDAQEYVNNERDDWER